MVSELETVVGLPDVDGTDWGPISLIGGVIIPRYAFPCCAPSQFMFRGQVRPFKTTMWFCSDAIFPSVNDERSGEADHPALPPVGHQRPLLREDEPHGRWMRSSR